MTRRVVDRLTAILDASPGRRNVFIKVGDSITISNHFLKCFAGKDYDLGPYGNLEPTRRFFGEVLLGAPKNSFDRASLANRVGWTARDVRMGSPTPIETEIMGTRPAFAVMMFGTNGSYPSGVLAFEQDLLANVDLLLSKGVIPLLSTIPPKLYHPDSSAVIPEMNAIVRMIAQARQVPLMDYYHVLVSLSDHGLAKDGVHPRPHIKGYAARGCWLTSEALQAGMNQRNLITLTALDRVRRFLLEKESPEPEPPALEGQGTRTCPYQIDQVPFVDVGETVASEPASASGGEQSVGTVYSLSSQKATHLRARLFFQANAKYQLCWENDRSSRKCSTPGDHDLDLFATPGPNRVFVLAPRSDKASVGGYRLTVVPIE